MAVLAVMLRAAAASNRRRASAIVCWLSSAHSPSACTGTLNDRPSSVKAYSTLGGTVGCTVRVTSPSRSSARKVRVNMRCEMPPTSRLISLNRLGPLPSRFTTSTVHLSPMRASTCADGPAVAGQMHVPRFQECASLWPAPRGHLCSAGYKTIPRIRSPSCPRSSSSSAASAASSINRKLAEALTKLAKPGTQFTFARIDDLPLFSQDLEPSPPAAVTRLKRRDRGRRRRADPHARVQPLDPGVLKNAIDWASRPYGKNSFDGKPTAATRHLAGQPSARPQRSSTCAASWPI